MGEKISCEDSEEINLRKAKTIGGERLVLQSSVQIILSDHLDVTIRKRNYPVRFVLRPVKTSDPLQCYIGGLNKDTRIDWLPIIFQIPVAGQDAIQVGDGI